MSFGANVAVLRVAGAGAPDLRPAFVAAAVLAAGLGAWRWRGRPGPVRDDFAGHAFVAGALLYAGAFALGNNWAYRLATLVLLLPQLAAWRMADPGGPGARRSARLVVLVLVAAWCVADPLGADLSAPFAPLLWLAGQAATWALAIALAYACGAVALAAHAPDGAGAADPPAPSVV